MRVGVHGQTVQKLPVLLHTLVEGRLCVGDQLSNRVCGGGDEKETQYHSMRRTNAGRKGSGYMKYRLIRSRNPCGSGLLHLSAVTPGKGKY